MPPWTQNPTLIAQLLEHEARHNPALRRRLAIITVLEQRGFTPWHGIVQHVENELGTGVFGKSPQARVWSDIRALRDAGIVIGYSRIKGATGYYIGLESVQEEIRTVIEQVFRDLDFEHLKRVAKAPPAQRMDSLFKMIAFGIELSEAGRRMREQQTG
jgi:hypothetical protein